MGGGTREMVGLWVLPGGLLGLLGLFGLLGGRGQPISGGQSAEPPSRFRPGDYPIEGKV